MSAHELDLLLAAPEDDTNPVGHAAVLAADERQEMLAEGELALDRYCLNAEFVPVEYGGRLDRVDRLAEILRTVWRRDPCLGLGYGFSSFIASVNIWSSGDEEQKRKAAQLLLANKKIAAAFHELDHGNDFTQAELAAEPAADGWLLSGRKEVVTNLRRAEALVLFARTGEGGNSRAHSQFFIAKDGLPAEGMRDMPRFTSSGMHGVQLGGVEFDRWPIPRDTMLGKPGQGVEIAMRSYQITRATVPSIIAGPLDAALRTAVGYAGGRRLYGGTAADIPYVRTVIARCFADLLAVDAFSSVGIRALHLLPETMGVYAPAAKYLTARIVLDAFEDLRSVLGAAAYLREGPYAIFQKLARDIAPATFAHVSRAACLTTLLPQLPRLARRSWLTDPSASPELFALGADLPPLRLDRLSPGMPREDGIIGALAEIADRAPGDGAAGRFASRFLGELRVLSKEFTDFSPADITMDASPAAFDLADRYTVVLAAACALAVWDQGDEDRYPRAALLGVLDRLNARLGGPFVLNAAERGGVEAQMFDLAAERCQNSKLLDLTARVIPN